MDTPQSVAHSCRRILANGLAGRTNELLVRVASTVEAVANVVFFPGDVQDARDEMMAGSFTEYAEYAYENVAALLADKFGDDTNVWIVRPSRFERGVFACFEGFVQCNKFGAVKSFSPSGTAVPHLMSLMASARHVLVREAQGAHMYHHLLKKSSPLITPYTSLYFA
ncbi:hypothetical protein PINS_up023771 [Pythium insidiosum]|nr:hypothetical protein PINS_up023771 [Pythium insidiosum]